MCVMLVRVIGSEVGYSFLVVGGGCVVLMGGLSPFDFERGAGKRLVWMDD